MVVMMVRRHIVSASLAGMLLATIGTGLARAQAYHFRQDAENVNRIIQRATVRIFPSETGDQIGSGVLIDADEGLVLSAGHVVKPLPGVAWVAFTDDDDRHRAKV